MSASAEPKSGMRDFRQSLPMAFLKAREAAMARFRPMLRQHGLTEQQWRVLRALAEYGEIDAGDLAAASFLLAPSLTRILQHLETEGIVRRTPDASDQRRQRVALTARGRRLFRRIAPQSESIYADIESSFGTGRLEDLYRLLDEFEVALAGQDAG